MKIATSKSIWTLAVVYLLLAVTFFMIDNSDNHTHIILGSSVAPLLVSVLLILKRKLAVYAGFLLSLAFVAACIAGYTADWYRSDWVGPVPFIFKLAMWFSGVAENAIGFSVVALIPCYFLWRFRNKLDPLYRDLTNA